jgi:uncharacterized protein
MNLPFLQPHKEGVTLAVRVTPKSSRSQIAGIVGDELKITLNAPPADGQANKELVRLLSKTFAVPKSRIEIISGETSRSKRVLLRGIDLDAIQSSLSMP